MTPHLLAQAFVDQHIAARAQPMCALSVEEARRKSGGLFALAPSGPPLGE